MNISKTTISLALTAALGTTGALIAAENPFGMQTLDSGYLHVADAKTGDGKCGANMKSEEGKCSGNVKSEEGKCGASKKTVETKAVDGKCGEGKCGANKK
jgi:uncharacterized low-complexity protein